MSRLTEAASTWPRWWSVWLPPISVRPAAVNSAAGCPGKSSANRATRPARRSRIASRPGPVTAYTSSIRASRSPSFRRSSSSWGSMASPLTIQVRLDMMTLPHGVVGDGFPPRMVSDPAHGADAGSPRSAPPRLTASDRSTYDRRADGAGSTAQRALVRLHPHRHLLRVRVGRRLRHEDEGEVLQRVPHRRTVHARLGHRHRLRGRQPRRRRDHGHVGQRRPVRHADVPLLLRAPSQP